jgi:RNA polymerase sigma-70 factor (ECF subfamily)
MISQVEAQKTSECVRRLKMGERAAFDEIVAIYKKRAFSCVYGVVGNVEDTKDIVQEGFLKVYAHIAGFRDESKFFTWFYRILINLARDFLRKKVRANKTFVAPFESDDGEARPLEVADESLSPERLVLGKELESQLDEAVSALPGNQKLAFCMKYREGYKVKEIAEVLRCRPSTVKVHLFRACAAVHQRLEPYLKK